MSARVTAAAKPAKPAKPAAAKTRKTVARKSGKAGRAHSGKASAAASAKHQAHVKHEEHLAHEKKSLAVGDALPVCAFEALAMSLRLAGRRVADDDVAELWWLAGADPDGASVVDALAAAARFGLAGCRPVNVYAGQVRQAGELAAIGHAAVDEFLDGHVFDYLADDLAALTPGGQVRECRQWVDAAKFQPLIDLARGALDIHALILGAGGEAGRDSNPRQPFNARPARCSAVELPASPALILGVDVPGPHCVLATADGWWSWGELHDPWPCRVDQAWAVSWS